MTKDLTDAQFTFSTKKYGVVVVRWHATGEMSPYNRPYYRITVLRNGEHPKIGMPSLENSSYPNKNNAWKLGKELLDKPNS